MTVLTVWLLVMVGSVNSGALGAVQPFMFPTAGACEQVARSIPQLRYGEWRCVQAQVVKP